MSAIHRTHCKDCNVELDVFNCTYNGRSRGARCKPCFNKSIRDYRARNPEITSKIQRRYHLKSSYNLTPEEYETLLVSQNSVCAICKRTCENNNKLSVDHDHETNDVRGLLCNNCNVLIGYAKSDISLLLNCIDYLTKYGTLKLNNESLSEIM